MGKKKKKTRYKTKYNPKYIETVRMLVLQCGMINRGSIAWKKVAQCLGVAPRTLRNWLDPREALYKKEFAEAVAAVQEEVDTGKVKRDTLTAASRHTLVKTLRVARTVGPKPPKASYRKEELIEYAAKVLKPPLAMDMGMAKGAMQLAIAIEVKKQTKVKMVKTHTQEQEVDPNPEARRIILKNLGKVEDRWNLKDEIDGGAIATINISYVELDEDPNKGKSIEDDSKNSNSDDSGGGESDDSQG